MSWVRTGAACAGAELRRWRRQRLAVASALVLPGVMAALVSVALGRATADVDFTFAVVDLEHGAASAAFVDQALGDPAVAEVVETRLVADGREAGRLLDDGDVDAVVTLPGGLGADLAGGGDVRIGLDAGSPLAADLATMVIDRYVVEARATALSLARTGRAPNGPPPLRVEVTAPGGQRLDAAGHYGPAIGMFFVLAGLGFAAQRTVADRRRGLADRLAATSASQASLVTGRAAAAMAVGALSLGTTAAVMQVLFGRPWGPPEAVVALIGATVVALAGVAAVVAVVSRTPEQASIASTAVAFVFALASGSFSPPGTTGTRSGLADLVPTTHALDGFALVATEQVGAAGMLGPIVTLCGFGVAGGAATALLTRARRFAL